MVVIGALLTALTAFVGLLTAYEKLRNLRTKPDRHGDAFDRMAAALEQLAEKL